MKTGKIILAAIGAAILLCGCSGTDLVGKLFPTPTFTPTPTPTPTPSPTPTPTPSPTPTPTPTPQEKEIKKALRKAKKLAGQYDYDRAITRLQKVEGYEEIEDITKAIKKYKKQKKACVEYPLEEITHVSFLNYSIL